MASNKMEGVIRENWKKVIVLSCFLSDSHVIETTNSSENPFPIHWGQTYQTALKFPNENRLGVLLQKHRQFCHSGELNRQAKGVSRNVDLRHEKYKTSLVQTELSRAINVRIRSEKHRLETVHSNKIILNQFDDKRYILDDGISTLPSSRIF